MAIIPENTSDTAINQMWDAEGPMSDDEKIERLFANELKKADAVQAALNRLDRLMHEKPADELLAAFKKAGDKASFHYADDSTKEWPQADKAKAEALAIFDAHPELHAQLREIAVGFLWLLSVCRPPRDDVDFDDDLEDRP